MRTSSELVAVAASASIYFGVGAAISMLLRRYDAQIGTMRLSRIPGRGKPIHVICADTSEVVKEP